MFLGLQLTLLRLGRPTSPDMPLQPTLFTPPRIVPLVLSRVLLADFELALGKTTLIKLKTLAFVEYAHPTHGRPRLVVTVPVFTAPLAFVGLCNTKPCTRTGPFAAVRVRP